MKKIIFENKIQFLVTFLIGCMLTIPVNISNRSKHVVDVSYAVATSYAMGNALCEGQNYETAITLGHAGKNLKEVYGEQDYNFLFSSWVDCKAKRYTRQAWGPDQRKEEALVILMLVNRKVFEDHIPFTKKIVERSQDNPEEYMSTLVRKTFSTSQQKEYFNELVDITYSYVNVFIFFVFIQMVLLGCLYAYFLRKL